jgi:hypothetical protein
MGSSWHPNEALYMKLALAAFSSECTAGISDHSWAATIASSCKRAWRLVLLSQISASSAAVAVPEISCS